MTAIENALRSERRDCRDKMAPVIENFVKKAGAKGKAYVDGVIAAA